MSPQISPEVIKRVGEPMPQIRSAYDSEHRALVISAAAELEHLLVARLKNEFLRLNPRAPENAIDRLFTERGVLSAFLHMSTMAYHLGTIEAWVLHDLRRIGKLRNRYAHDRDRGQLDQDIEMLEILKSTEIYRANAALQELRAEGLLRCICAHLADQIQLRLPAER